MSRLGLRRRSRSIEKWRQANLFLDAKRLLDGGLAYDDKRCYAKLWIEPWANLFVKASPKKGHRSEMFSALLDIYERWEKQLAETGQPYYLKVWLFDPYFMNSQVVCAWGETRDFYLNTFTASAMPASIPLNKFEGLDDRIGQFDWKTCLDEDFYFESELNGTQPYASERDRAYDQRLLRRLRSGGYKSFKTGSSRQDIGYSIPRGYVWVGQRK